MIICGLPGSYFPKVRTFWEWFGPDKIVHSILFACFSFSIMFGYKKEYCERGKAYRVNLQLIALIVSVLYAALTEVLQAHVFIGRCGSVYDFFADVIGCVLGVFILKIIFRKKMIKK